MSSNKYLKNVLKSTSLEMMVENRTGERLELVFMVFNEQARLKTIVEYYKKDFDIVLLDGGSIDNTISIAKSLGCTIFSRKGESVGENHFTLYANKLTKSGYSFYMMADEFVQKQDLLNAFVEMKSNGAIVSVKKIEWAYGQKISNSDQVVSSGMPRGFIRGYASYDPMSLHNSLGFANDLVQQKKEIVCDLHHLHIKDIASEYGKHGRSICIETEQLFEKKLFGIRLLRRFLVPFFTLIIYRSWRSNTTLSLKFFRILESLNYLILAVMSTIERKYLKDKDDQYYFYSQIYKD